jgi:hypothetical protein
MTPPSIAVLIPSGSRSKINIIRPDPAMRVTGTVSWGEITGSRVCVWGSERRPYKKKLDSIPRYRV